VREQIIVKLETLLRGIPSIKLVTREFTPIDDIAANQFPAIIIEDDGAEEFFDKVGGVADVSFEVAVIGYVSQINGVSTALNTLDVDIKKAIALDMTLGGLAMAVRIMPYKTRSGSKFSPYGFFERPLKITYEGTLAGGL